MEEQEELLPYLPWQIESGSGGSVTAEASPSPLSSQCPSVTLPLVSHALLGSCPITGICFGCDRGGDSLRLVWRAMASARLIILLLLATVFWKVNDAEWQEPGPGGWQS